MRFAPTALALAACRIAARPSMVALWVALLALGMAATPARAQCEPGACATAQAALWLGDLDNNNAVDDDDLIVLQRCFMPGAVGSGGVYCDAADFNFDGVINDIDLNYLQRVVILARTGSVKKLPRAQLSELRVRKPLNQTAPAIPQSRYVEVRVPLAAASLAITDPPTEIQAPTVNGVLGADTDVRVFEAGWYYLKVLWAIETANPTQSVRGMIAVAVPLEGMVWVSNPTFTTTRGLGLMVDGSFVGSPVEADVPPAMVPYVFDIAPASLAVPGSAGAFTFLQEQSTNVTHMLVFRNPLGPRVAPAVGQRINVAPGSNNSPNCYIPWTVPGTPDDLPPFDAIVDCVTIVRGIDEDVYGCIFAKGLSFRIGPVGGVGFTYAPPHIYRCRNAGTWTRGVDAISDGSDSPFIRNPTCVTQIQGCGELNPDGSSRDCFDAQSGAGCSDADCCQAVCQLDPSCCTTEWDSNCVAQAQFTCTQCGVNPASCLAPHSTPSCNDPECCKSVCDIDPFCCNVQWNEDCVHTASKVCLACGDSATGECTEVHDLPYCNDAECCAAVCDNDPFCCEVTWDTVCVQNAAAVCSGCGSLNAGDCCIIHPTPHCSNGACCTTVCAIDPFCCQTAWDLGCTQLALVWCGNLDCACGSGGPCLSVSNAPGCADGFCCQTVCLHDPYCCLVRWDAACVAIARDLCATNPGCLDPNDALPVLGSCYVPHASVGCDQPGCCSQVCAVAGYEYCCTVEWDASCAVQAAEICDKCGDPLSGSCFEGHGTPNCANAICCDAVCNVDSFCCTETWDGLCAITAFSVCQDPVTSCGGSTTRSCFIPGFNPGCRVPSCCTAVCTNIDPYCCEVRWDAVCAREATYFCPANFPVTIGNGACLTPHPEPGCANLDCARSVCSVKPVCCSVEWDESCVTIAAAVCVAADACPSTGDCFTTHANPGCADSACCAGVCTADPSCCDGSWDNSCALLARQLCRTPPGENWPCPCVGLCTEAHDNPGCSDGSCCNIVCQGDPYCCDEVWDSICVAWARLFCCGTPGCGSGCNKPCLEPHEEPFCSDPFCCDAVCRADPLCCTYSWDSLCVTIAAERCAGACGLVTAGNCFIPHEFAGCRDGRCCAQICAIDPLCCQESWDDVCVKLADAPEQAAACKRTTCGQANAGDCCTPHDSQGCKNQDCCEAVCAQDSYCCDTEWDSNCTDIARTVTECGCTFECGDACAGSCCRAHSNGSCDDADCCKAVCAQDSYCCEVEWDSVCAAVARSTCTGQDEACPVPPCGSSLLPSCCVPGFLPNCSKKACCERICLTDPFCCEIQWDLACATAAQAPENQSVCGCQIGGCGDPTSGSCFQEHDDPFCDDLGCCQTVCAFDELCCSVEWDENCVLVAEFFCGGSFAPLVDAFGGTQTAQPRFNSPLPDGWVPPRQRVVPKPKMDLPKPPVDGSRPALPAGPSAVPGSQPTKGAKKG